MAFGFGSDLGVSHGGFSGRSSQFGGLGGGLSVGGSGRGGGGDPGSQLNAMRARSRQQQRGGGFNPGFNPEMGGGQVRQRATEAVSIDRDTTFASLLRGDLFGAFEIFERETGEQLGIEQDVEVNPDTGAFGLRGSLNLLTPPANLMAGMGLSAALAALNMVGPATAGQLGLQTLGQRSTVRSGGAFLGAPNVNLGFAPLPGELSRTRQRQALGLPLDAQNQLAIAFGETQRARRDRTQQGRGRDSGTGDPQRTVAQLATSPQRVTPAIAPPRGAPDTSSAARFLAGRDPRLGIDVLRTTGEALVASGAARPKASVGSVFRPPLPGALV